MNKQINLKRIVFIAAFVTMFLIAAPILNARNNFIVGVQVDELYYKDVTQRIHDTGGYFSVPKVDYETKTPVFLALQTFLQAYNGITYTRAMNVALIAFISILMYFLTRRYESFLFVMIPAFLNSMWLTNEILEVTFVLLGIVLAKYSGIFVGIATLFRPYALLYTPLLKKKQWLSVICIGMIYVIILFYTDSFWFYLTKVSGYAISPYIETDYVALLILGLFIYLGYKTPMFWYGVLAMIPLYVRLYGHYFLPSFAFFYLGYLMTLNLNEPKFKVDDKIKTNNLFFKDILVKPIVNGVKEVVKFLG